MPAPRFPTEKDVERGNDVHEKKLCHTQTWGTTSTDISNKRYSIQSGPINMASTDVSSIASLVDHRGSKHKGMSWWQAATGKHPHPRTSIKGAIAPLMSLDDARTTGID